MSEHLWLTIDCLKYIETQKDKSHALVLADPPYSNYDLINKAIIGAKKISSGACVFFMYAEDLCRLKEAAYPDQICQWLKPISTKNTTKKYSRFFEALVIYHGEFFNQNLHWSTRVGVFTDTIITTDGHPHKKPESLIEKLILLHLKPPFENKTVLDLFGGSGTVEAVCRKLQVNSITCEIDPKWKQTK